MELVEGSCQGLFKVLSLHLPWRTG